MRRDLIIDVGMHVGYDTEFYLAKGFDVVAVEANPALVQIAEEKFAREIKSGRLRVFGAAVARDRGRASLAVSNSSELSTLSAAEVAFAERHGAKFHHIDVPAIPFEDVLEEVGIPYYLKVDIEGSDMLCVDALHHFGERPRYISIESNIASAGPRWAFDEILGDVAALWSLGYRRFKYINQMREYPLPNPPLEGTTFAAPIAEAIAHGLASGGFGEETPGRWRTAEWMILQGWALRLQYMLGGWRGRWSNSPTGKLYRGVRNRILKRPKIGFFDLHAAWEPLGPSKRSGEHGRARTEVPD